MTLVGLGLVSLPLLLAVGTATLKLDDLTRESAELASTMAAAAARNQEVSQALRDMERFGRQYLVLRGTERLDYYHDAADRLDESIRALEAQPVPEGVDDDFASLRRSAATVTAVVESAVDLPSDADIAPSDEAVLAEISAMRNAASVISNTMSGRLRERLIVLQGDMRSARGDLVWLAAALIPIVLLLIVFFVLFVARPMRQIDRVIRELGENHYSRPIAVRGPGDIETLGRQLEWLRLRLAESSEEKNRFLRHMSHELKTPLANIREGTELLLDGSVGVLDRQQQEVTNILRENSVKLQRLIENLLTFSAWQAKTASLEISQFELKPLVFVILSQHRLVITSRGIQLKIEVAPISIRADEGRLRLVLENLVSNAIKFTPDNGEISVHAGMDGDELVIEVADSGPGVAQEDRERIFEAFYQGRRQPSGSVGGTGIGLSVVSECVAAHGGTIELKPGSSGQGAHFIVRLPWRHVMQKPRLVANA
jgi:two-component system sensor histidine kinase GlrK